MLLSRLKKAGLTLDLGKCEINKKSVKLPSQLVEKTGVRPNPYKVQAIQQMKPPSTVSELRSKFSPHLARQKKHVERSTEFEKPVHWETCSTQGSYGNFCSHALVNMRLFTGALNYS